ncbi:MAG: four helix bundle protein [Candidatus Didemnitutus sp.]|nr:four helix bundle protein [Candidatus Didemnitutus sp.]
MLIQHFTELVVYQRSRELAERIFLLSKRWPPIERFALTDQIRRAARSVGANISESWAKRRYAAHFVSKLTDADGENHEVEHWLLVAHRDGYLSTTEFEQLLAIKREVGAKLGKMIQNPGPFLLR